MRTATINNPTTSNTVTTAGETNGMKLKLSVNVKGYVEPAERQCAHIITYNDYYCCCCKYYYY